jgi:hypothetical protein
MDFSKQQELVKKLRDKGWPEKDIHKTLHVIEKRNYMDKSGSHKKNSRLLYWSSLMVLFICNLLVAVFLVPFLLVLGGTIIYIIVASLGLIFGLFFNLLIRDIEHLEAHHHLFALLLVPLVSLVNIFIMVNVSKRVAEIIQVSFKLNPVLLSLVYVGAFIVPYLFYLVKYGVSKY